MSSSLSEEPKTGVADARCPVSHLAEKFDPFNDPYLQDPYSLWQEARKDEPVFYSPSLDYWIVSRYDDVRQVFMDTDSFSAAISITPLKELCAAAIDELVKAQMVMGPSLVNEDPPLHTDRRKHIRDALVSPARIEEVRPRIREFANRYIDGFVQRGHADLVTDFAWEIPALVAFALMGVPDEDVERAKEYSGRLALFTWGYPSEEEQTQLAAGMGQYWTYAKEHVQRRLEEPTDDYISELIKAWRTPGNEELFDENYLVTTMMNFLFAGHETTTNATANGLLALMENREQWDALCADPSLAANAVEEILRYSSSVIAWRREVVKDAVVGGVKLPAGSKVLAVTGSANHDESVFPEAACALRTHMADQRRTHPHFDLAAVAADQHGVVSTRQLAAIGYARSTVAKGQGGRLHRIHRGVYAVGHTDLTHHGR